MDEEKSYHPGPWGPGTHDPLKKWPLVYSVCDFRDKSVLDIGCASGWYSRRVAEEGAALVVAYESGRNEYNKAKSIGWNIETHNKDFFESGETRKFDVILLLSVLHYYPPSERPRIARLAADRCSESGLMFVECAEHHPTGNMPLDDIEAMLNDIDTFDTVTSLGRSPGSDRTLFACLVAGTVKYHAPRFSVVPLSACLNRAHNTRLWSIPCVVKENTTTKPHVVVNEAVSYALARVAGISTPAGFVRDGKWHSATMGHPVEGFEWITPELIDPDEWARIVVFNIWIGNRDFCLVRKPNRTTVKGVSMQSGSPQLFDFDAAIFGAEDGLPDWTGFTIRLHISESNLPQLDNAIVNLRTKVENVTHLPSILDSLGVEIPGGATNLSRCLMDRLSLLQSLIANELAKDTD